MRTRTCGRELGNAVVRSVGEASVGERESQRRGTRNCLKSNGRVYESSEPNCTGGGEHNVEESPGIMSDTRSNILIAAKQCYLDRGISATGMREVAIAAGVARSTLYRYFPGRDDVLVSTIKLEMEIANTWISEQLGQFDQPADFIVEGLLLALDYIPNQPLLKAVFASDQDAAARRIIWRSDIIVSFGEELMFNVVRPAQDAKLLQCQVSAEVMVEWVYRVLLSFLTLPSNSITDKDHLRASLHALLVPVLLR
ncbi:MAG: TetR/AcrR family transcriptional regulator [Halioglobus sp.]